MRGLTAKQVSVLERVRVVRDQQVAGLLKECPGCTPSSWVSLDVLIRVHHQDRRVLEALVKKGWLLERPTSYQQGPEVLVKGDS